MATVQEAVRRLSIQATTSGVKEAKQDLEGLAEAQQGVAVASSQTEKATLALESRFEKIERRYVAQVRQQREYEKVQRDVNAAVAQNPALQDRANAVLESAATRLKMVTAAANENAVAMARQAAEMQRAAAVQPRINAMTGVTGGSDSAARAADVAAYGQQLDALRAKYNPLFAAGRQYKEALTEINMAARVGAISEKERADAIMSTKAAFTQQVNSLRGVTEQEEFFSRASAKAGVAAKEMAVGAGLVRHELINLSRQAQDVVVSIAGGQGLGTVLLQQGSQIADVFANSQGTVGGFFRQMTGWLGSFLTLGRAAFGGVAAAIAGATVTLNSYLDAQHRVNLALAGAGRASGATNADINSIARAGAGNGLSVSAARDLASALASTGKVAKDNFLPIVQMGRDFATTFGVDATQAAEMLSKAFSDPIKGAEQLNDRLGFLSEAMRRQIQNLVEQNRMYDAQKVLLAGVQSSLASTAQTTSIWSQMWVGLKNSASDFFDWLGEKLADGLHLNDTLEQQAKAIKSQIESYETGWGRIFGSSADLEMLRKQLSDINTLIDKRAQATRNAVAAQESLRVANAVFAQLPEIQQRQSLANRAAATEGAANSPFLQRFLGISQEEANRSAAISKQLRDDFKTTFQEISINAKIASDAVTAFSPSAKALIAARQAVEQYRAQGGLDPAEKAKIAQDAYNLSLKQSAVAMSEAARARELSAQQSVASAELEAQLVGKTIGQQTELRANLAARQQLEQQASQNRTAFDEAEYARLQKINEELGRRVELAARAAANDNIRFGSQTALLSPDDVQIAQQLRGIYPDVATALGSVEAAGLRTNAALSSISSSISGTLVTGLADVADGTKSVGQGAADMGKAVARAIEEMIIKMYIVIPLMRSLQMLMNSMGGLGGLGSIFSGGAAAAGATASPLLAGSLYHSGGMVGAGGATRSVHPAVFHGAPRYHAGGIAGLLPDEVPAILQRGERVVPRGQSLGGNVNITINGAPSTPKVTQQDRPNGDRDIMIDFANAVKDVMVKDAATDGRASQAMRARAVGFGGR